MDHPCHKCGHSIEDGRAFCSQCGAPQIRVSVAEAPVDLAEVDDSSPSGLHEPATGFPDVPLISISARWSNAIRPCALAAAVAVVLMFLGLNPFIAALGAGFLATTFSQRRSLVSSIRPAVAARLGALSGLLLFAMSTIFETLAVVVLHKGGEIRSEMLDKIQQAAMRYPGPEVAPFLDFAKSPDGFALILMASLAFGLAAFVVLGAVGGAVSAAIAGRRNRP